MNNVATAGALLGLAFASGLRLYSTVLAVGLSLRYNLLSVPESLADLRLLGETPVLAIAGLMYTAEFFADKVPWIDTAWDTAHTFFRPLGAALLGAVAIGDVDPVAKVVAGLVCGSVALSSHSAKAGTRLVVNHSPEPFSNIGLSFAEDGVVAGGVWLALVHPVVALVLVLISLAVIAWMIPKLFRLFRRQALRVRDLLNSDSDGRLQS